MPEPQRECHLMTGDKEPRATLARSERAHGIAVRISAQGIILKLTAILLVIESEAAVCEAWWPMRRAPWIKCLAPHREAYGHRSNSAAAIPAILGVDHRRE